MVHTSAPTARSQAERAADRSGVRVRVIDEVDDLRQSVDLFCRVWRSGPPVTVELMRALTHGGGYVAGAYNNNGLVGASVAMFTARPGVLHSHISGVAPEAQDHSVGFALKLHQRAWALDHGIEAVSWTFDPLVRRNAYFNLSKLGARPSAYLVNFYGVMNDGINAGAETDRLHVTWVLASDDVVRRCDGVRHDPSDSPSVQAIEMDRDGAPTVAVGDGRMAHDTVLCATPPDIEPLRRSDPRAAGQWRHAVRAVLDPAMRDGYVVRGLTPGGSYVLSRG